MVDNRQFANQRRSQERYTRKVPGLPSWVALQVRLDWLAEEAEATLQAIDALAGKAEAQLRCSMYRPAPTVEFVRPGEFIPR